MPPPATWRCMPLVKAGLIDLDQQVIVEIKVGSSEGGAEGNPGSHHPERSSVIRTFSPFGHRHTAEVIQEMGLNNVSLTMTSVDLVRGALATAHARVKPAWPTRICGKPTGRASNENPIHARGQGTAWHLPCTRAEDSGRFQLCRPGL